MPQGEEMPRGESPILGKCDVKVCLLSLSIEHYCDRCHRVNAKLGGINNILENSPLNDLNHPTIVMGMTDDLSNSCLSNDMLGADVIHPAPGAEGRPSFTSLVTSVDRYTAKYIATSKVQTGRQEIIADLEDMVKYALNKYMLYRKAIEKTNSPPTRLIFYRGTSIPSLQNPCCLS
jgi:eukaryotic translation initiation factor 2C